MPIVGRPPIILVSSLLYLFSLFFISCSYADSNPTYSAIVERQRKVIVLQSGVESTSEATKHLARETGMYIFHENQEAIRALTETLLAALPSHKSIAEFLSYLENNKELYDADKLVFRAVLDSLEEELKGSSDALERRIKEDIAALEEIRLLYDKEVTPILNGIIPRGMVLKREKWERYLEHIQRKYNRESIIKDVGLPNEEGSSTMRGSVSKPEQSPSELNGREIPKNTILLTFDDGPHPRYTREILAILTKYGVQALFFHVGKNLKDGKKGDDVLDVRRAEISKDILKQGSLIANHSYTHAFLPKLSPANLAGEIDRTEKLLDQLRSNPYPFFRPPFGARNKAVLSELSTRRLTSMLWNIDSKDWADPVPSSIVDRVMRSAEEERGGIVLFHDIHRQTIEVLPKVIEGLKLAGFAFASPSLVTGGVALSERPTSIVRKNSPYRKSFAVVIGIDEYKQWPKLKHAKKDADGLRSILIEKYGFEPENIYTLLNEEASRKNILSLLGDKLADPERVNRDDRVLVFYAGHGATRTLPTGRHLGYLIPFDTELLEYHGQAISMTELQDLSEIIPAKHLLFVMDSCYSGLGLTRGSSPTGGRYLADISKRIARQMLTAGGADQQVADNGPNGHSIFTWSLLQGLEGRADLNQDRVITASELASYVSPVVSSLSPQTPAFGNMVGSEGGDVIFELPHTEEFLTGQSEQLDNEAMALNSRLSSLLHQLEAKRDRNDKLKKRLSDLEHALISPDKAIAKSGRPRASARTLNDRGTALYKERKYELAIEKFQEALALDPHFALAANNLGFTYYKLEKFEEAIEWFLRSIEIDGERALAHLNLADAYVKVNNSEKAIASYKKYLTLAQSGKTSEYARQMIKSLADR